MSPDNTREPQVKGMFTPGEMVMMVLTFAIIAAVAAAIYWYS